MRHFLTNVLRYSLLTKSKLLFAFLILSGWAYGQNQPPAEITQQAIKKIPTNSTEYKDIYYLEHLPSDYETSDKRYPVIIFLHGASEQGDTTGQEINKVATWGPPMYIEEGNDMTFTANGVTESFIVISPQLQYATKDNWSASYIHEVVQHVIENYRVDIDRICMTGLSMGGGTIWNYEVQHPNILAAIAPVSSGWPFDMYMVRRAKEDRVAVWAFHGEIDPQISVELPQRWQDSLLSLGADPAPLLTIYPNIGHNVWSRAYTIDHSLQDPNLYEWFLTQRRYDTPFAPNQSPTAEAGVDTTVALPAEQIQLNGTASSDPEGSSLNYLWSQLDGPSAATLVDKDSSILTVSNLSAGTYTFQLSVSDYEKAEALDQVQVVITDGVVTDIEDSLSSKAMITYPNPADHQMTVLLTDPAAWKGTLVLTDLSGKILRQWDAPLTRANRLLQIDTETMPSGLYLLKLRANHSYMTKVFIEH